MIDRAGVFIAEVASCGISETGNPPKVTAIVALKLVAEQVGDNMEPLEDGHTITAWMYLEKARRDSGGNAIGTELNTFVLDTMKKVFEWDGLDPFWLADNITGHGCQVTIELDANYGNKPKVKWLNAIGESPVPKQASPDERRAITARLGGKLMAYSGGKTVEPKKPTPPAPKEIPAKPVKRAKVTEKPLTQAEVWSAFCKKHSGKGQDEIETMWFDTISVTAGKQDTEDLDAEDLSKIMKYITDNAVDGESPPF